MKRKWVLVIPFGMLAVCGVLIGPLHVTYNNSPSLPYGFYRAVGGNIGIGDFVIFSAPNRAPFSEAKRRGWFRDRLLKKVEAGVGDSVSIGVDGVFVEGKKIRNSEQKKADGYGRPMPVFSTKRALTKNEWLLMSQDDPWGFDARYFGALREDEIPMKKVVPLITWR
jgi:conjugative transfer signal peptidase TraF